uniref:CARD domain-containing protein n=1 Tax=Fundulus heteroclitus TaxID=8078 RepID=A0A3Q2SYF7_FUNHE
MSYGWTANPAASSSLSQNTTREIRNSTPATATRSPQVKLQNSFDSSSSYSSSSLEEIKESSGPVNYSVPIRSVGTDHSYASASESGLRRRDRSNSSPSLSWPLISQDPPADISILPRAASLPNMKLRSSFEEFTPDFTGDEDDETYWLRCSSPGLYQCRVSGLVFAMKAEGDVSYRIVPWSSRLLSQHGKKPAGPLFDIRCQQQSVAQLHLPHCEICSTDKCTVLSVVHVVDEGIEFIKPEKITETHVIINITGFSAFALVLLFYKPPAAPSVRHRGLFRGFFQRLRNPPAPPNEPSFLSVLLLPANVDTWDVKRKRKEDSKTETFIDVPPKCQLQPNQFYTLSTDPAGDSVLVQPTEAEFDAESYNNPLTSIQVILKSPTKDIRLSLKERNSSLRRSYGPTRQNIGPSEHLKEIRTSFMERISGPVLKSLLDKLLEIKVLRDAEREAVEGETIRGDKARLLVDMVRKKGDDASSEMIRSLCELDPFLSKYLELM